MGNKFTIKIDNKVMERAKIYARENNINLSRLIEDHLQFLTSTYKTDSYEITPLVKSLSGVLCFSDKEEFNASYKKYISKKYFK